VGAPAVPIHVVGGGREESEVLDAGRVQEPIKGLGCTFDQGVEGDLFGVVLVVEMVDVVFHGGAECGNGGLKCAQGGWVVEFGLAKLCTGGRWDPDGGEGGHGVEVQSD